MIDYREATDKDFHRIAQLSVQSFGNYPYFHSAFRHAFKNDNAYITYMEKLHRVHIKANASQNKCFVGMKDGEIVSAALLQDPAKKKAAVEDYVKAGGLGLVFPVGLSKILKFFHFSEDARADCDRNYPSAWYLEVLAVDGARKGSGLGSGMLQDCLIPYVQEQGGQELTLITNAEINRKFYTKMASGNFPSARWSRTGNRSGTGVFVWRCRDKGRQTRSVQKDETLARRRIRRAPARPLVRAGPVFRWPCIQ